MSTGDSRKIFISYKYLDKDVQHIDGAELGPDTDGVCTPRHYVDKVDPLLKGLGNISKAEKSDTDLSDLSEPQIWEHLKESIYDSTLTIVLMSPNMRVEAESEQDQWIPQEIRYSLGETERNDRKSHTNAILMVFLPDSVGSYEYALKKNQCSRTWRKNSFFPIIRKNMHNASVPKQNKCSTCAEAHNAIENSYIYPVLWHQFIENLGSYINYAYENQENLANYELVKSLTDE